VGCKGSKSAAIIDSGEEPTAFFAPHAESHSLTVDHLLQTHAHIDHVLGLKATKQFYPNAPIYMHELDLPTYALVEPSSINYGIPIDLPLPDIDIFLTNSLTVGNLNFEVIFTPGHAPGHCVFYCKELKFAFVGDLIFQGSVGRTDLPNCSLSDMKKSIQHLIASLPDDCLLLPGHGGVTSILDEKMRNPYVQDWCHR
jgi:glyoxylase-like metal-dependent hydrolase (beta-lactamase superfamily II)